MRHAQYHCCDEIKNKDSQLLLFGCKRNIFKKKKKGIEKENKRTKEEAKIWSKKKRGSKINTNQIIQYGT